MLDFFGVETKNSVQPTSAHLKNKQKTPHFLYKAIRSCLRLLFEQVTAPEQNFTIVLCSLNRNVQTQSLAQHQLQACHKNVKVLLSDASSCKFITILYLAHLKYLTTNWQSYSSVLDCYVSIKSVSFLLAFSPPAAAGIATGSVCIWIQYACVSVWCQTELW